MYNRYKPPLKLFLSPVISPPEISAPFIRFPETSYEVVKARGVKARGLKAEVYGKGCVAIDQPGNFLNFLA